MVTVNAKKAVGSSTVRHHETARELENYKVLVESVQDYAIFLMDTQGYIRTWNKGAEKNKGYKAEEIIGKHFSTFYRQIDLDSNKPGRELEIALKFGRAEDEDWRVRKDGSLFWASVVITALYDDEGKHIGFAKVTRDLTERKKHEDELRAANKLLRQQQFDLQQLNKSKDEFISLASHQLRTPATTIKQLLGLYVEGFLDIPQKYLDIIQKAYDSNERQIDIVNSLLKVAQVDAGKLFLRKEECSVGELLEECVSEFGEAAKKKQQQLILNEESTTKTLFIDEKNLRMALENIINNAIKYTYVKGTIEITTTEDENSFYITVSDNGVGIAQRDIAKLFKKFTRIQNDLSESEGGSGLGLYWAYKVISLHGGDIQVSSKLNEGTTFSIELPKGV
jgi:PAS domain S-box-containing protein